MHRFYVWMATYSFLGKSSAYFNETYRIVKKRKKTSVFSLCTNGQILRLNGHLFFLGKSSAYFNETDNIVKKTSKKRRRFPSAQMARFYVRMATYSF